MLIADSYDANTHKTTLTLLPYGNIDIPGKWTKTGYNSVSRQHYFSDADSTSIAVTKNPVSNYPFYVAGMSDADFTQKFFEWESEYYQKQGYSTEQLSPEKNSNRVIWSVWGNNVHSIFIYGAKNNIAYNFAVFSTNWSENERIKFLKELFENN